MDESERRRLRALPGGRAGDASDASAASASEDEGPTPPKKRLRFVDVLSEVPNGDAAAAVELPLADRGFTEVDSLEPFKGLKKLELQGNNLSDAACVEMSHQLCWLGLARNRLRKIAHLQNLHALAVLDVSDNRIARLDGLEGLAGLKACIAARNRIARLDDLHAKRHPLLETLVLSHNCVKECSLSGFKQLKKLSLGHNQLHAFPSLKDMPELAELRVNGNKISTVGACVGVLPKLSILDVGSNSIVDLKGLEPLRGLLKLKSLSVRGNTAAADCESGPLKALLESLPSLEILNDRRQSGASKKRNRQSRDGGKGKGKGKATPEPPAEPISNNGREFSGKRAVFGSSDEEGEAKAPVKVEAAVKAEAQTRVKNTPDMVVAERPKKRINRGKAEGATGDGEEGGATAEVEHLQGAEATDSKRSSGAEAADVAPPRPKKKKKIRTATDSAGEGGGAAPPKPGKHATVACEEPRARKLKKKRKPLVDAAVEPAAGPAARTKAKKRKVISGKA